MRVRARPSAGPFWPAPALGIAPRAQRPFCPASLLPSAAMTERPCFAGRPALCLIGRRPRAHALWFSRNPRRCWRVGRLLTRGQGACLSPFLCTRSLLLPHANHQHRGVCATTHDPTLARGATVPAAHRSTQANPAPPPNPPPTHGPGSPDAAAHARASRLHPQGPAHPACLLELYPSHPSAPRAHLTVPRTNTEPPRLAPK
jgi:hypothetical protein